MRCCSGWTARYKIWSIRRKTVLVDILIDLPQSQVATVLKCSTLEGGRRKLFLPVNFSSDLRHALVLHTLVRILPGDKDQPEEVQRNNKYVVQCLDLRHFPLDAKSVDTLFSPCAKYLAICVARKIHGRFIEGEILVWRDVSRIEDQPSFELHGKAVSNNFVNSEGQTSRNFAFHPTLPLLVFGGQRKTYVWHLEIEGKPQCFFSSW